MMAHLHTVLGLHQKAPSCTAWIEYDIQFRMEVAAVDDKTWPSGDPWQYVSCLPGPGRAVDPFDVAEQHVVSSGEPKQALPEIASLSPHMGTPGQSGVVTKGKHPLDQGNSQNAIELGKRPKKPGLCRLFDRAPSDCPYMGMTACLSIGTASVEPTTTDEPHASGHKSLDWRLAVSACRLNSGQYSLSVYDHVFTPLIVLYKPLSRQVFLCQNVHNWVTIAWEAGSLVGVRAPQISGVGAGMPLGGGAGYIYIIIIYIYIRI